MLQFISRFFYSWRLNCCFFQRFARTDDKNSY